MSDEYNWARLLEPFPASAIHWRVGNRHKTKNKASLLAYLDARNVMSRMDEVFGPGNWQDTYTTGPDGGVKCTLSVYCHGQWVHKEDGAENTQVEAIKGGYSGALKRAAVKWGIGRYLYDLDSRYHDIEEAGHPMGWTPSRSKVMTGGDSSVCLSYLTGQGQHQGLGPRSRLSMSQWVRAMTHRGTGTGRGSVLRSRTSMCPSPTTSSSSSAWTRGGRSLAR